MPGETMQVTPAAACFSLGCGGFVGILRFRGAARTLRPIVFGDCIERSPVAERDELTRCLGRLRISVSQPDDSYMRHVFAGRREVEHGPHALKRPPMRGAGRSLLHSKRQHAFWLIGEDLLHEGFGISELAVRILVRPDRSTETQI